MNVTVNIVCDCFLPVYQVIYAKVLPQVRAFECKNSLLKGEFHYTSWFGASSKLAPNMFGASSEPASVMEFAANLLARASSLLAS